MRAKLKFEICSFQFLVLMALFHDEFDKGIHKTRYLLLRHAIQVRCLSYIIISVCFRTIISISLHISWTGWYQFKMDRITVILIASCVMLYHVQEHVQGFSQPGQLARVPSIVYVTAMHTCVYFKYAYVNTTINKNYYIFILRNKINLGNTLDHIHELNVLHIVVFPQLCGMLLCSSIICVALYCLEITNLYN